MKVAKLRTKADEILQFIREKGEVELKELVQFFGEDERIERWIRIFEKRGLIKVLYPPNPFSGPVLKAVRT